jgi:hypothetical protein
MRDFGNLLKLCRDRPIDRDRAFLCVLQFHFKLPAPRPTVGVSSARFVVTQIAGTALVVTVAAFFYRYFELPFLTGLRRRPVR